MFSLNKSISLFGPQPKTILQLFLLIHNDTKEWTQIYDQMIQYRLESIVIITILKINFLLQRQHISDSLFADIISEWVQYVLNGLELVGFGVGDVLFHADCE